MPPAGFFADNPYLFSELFCLATVGLACFVAGPQRRMMLLAGAVTLPFFPFGGLFDSAYWSPVRVANLGGWWFGFEDPIYTFVLGARAWFVASIAFRSRYVAMGGPALFVRRAIPVTAVALAAYAGLVALGLGFIVPALLVPVALAAWALARKPELWPLALCGAAGCGALYYAELVLWFRIWPQLSGWWMPGTPWSRDFFGAPIGDVVWSAIVGACHPAVLGYFCDVCRVERAGRR